MTAKFKPGSIVYAKDGRSYTVEVVDGGTVYCTASNGIETEFPAESLVSESDWSTQSDGRREISYTRIKQSRFYGTSPDRIETAMAEQVLSKAERLSPSVLDFTAFTIAQQILVDNKNDDQLEGLSIVKSRQIFDEAAAAVRVRLLAQILGVKQDNLASAVRLGDNLMRAMLDKGLAAHGTAFDDFLDRPRR